MTTLTAREHAEVDAANASGRRPVVLVHGLWLLASSWAPWRTHFESAGYAVVAAEWPDDPTDVAAGRAHPEAFAGKSVGQITDHVADVVRGLHRRPVVIGHSFGGLITQKIAGMGLASAAVAIDPGPIKGVFQLPISSLRAAFPVLGNPLNYRRQVMLSPAQFRFAFANAVDADEADRLYEQFPVPGSGIPLFQAAFANFRPGGQTAADTRNPDRGPLLVISGEKDNTVPHAIALATFEKQRRNPGITEFHEVPGRGHSLVIDSGWREVADVALEFAQRSVGGSDRP